MPLAVTVCQRGLTALALLFALPSLAGAQTPEQNKAIARQFYEDVWFAPRTDSVADLVAPEYVVHDVGDLKGVRERGDSSRVCSSAGSS